MLKLGRLFNFRYARHHRHLSYPTESLVTPVTNLVKPPSLNKTSFTIPQDTETEITTLSNGLKVATHASFGQYSTVGVFIDNGSRYEVKYPSGVSHFLSKMAFQSSSQFSSRQEIIKELEEYGGLPEFQMFRDLSFYNISAFTFAVPRVIEVLADLIWRPQVLPSELEECRQSITFELEELERKPHPETLLMELAHQASYRYNTLGLPSVCPRNNITKIKLSDLMSYLSSHYIPQRMVLVGVNVDHSQLVKLGEKHFVHPVTSWKDTQSLSLDDSISQYTGGQIHVSRDSAPIIGPNRLPDLTHIAISMESSSYHDKDFYTYAVLNSLMGGGGSFSAGGPGKGMYTQLYLNVLNKHHWIYHAQAMNHAYSDSGIFCLFGSCHPSQTRDLVRVLCSEFYQMTQPANPIAVTRAKKQLQSTLLMNLESRLINFEDIGRQVLAHGTRKSAKYLCQKIDEVTPEDISRVAQRMYEQSPPSLAALGDLSNVPDIKEIEKALVSNKGELSKRNGLFSFITK